MRWTLFAQDSGGSEVTELAKEKASFLMNLVAERGPAVLGALLFLIVGWIIAGWIAALVRRAMTKGSVDITLTRFVAILASMAVKVLVVISALGIFGVPTASFAAILGGAGLAVGLALQGTLGSFAAGVMLLVFRPFSVGDVVTVNGVTAKVFEIGIFSTALDSPDNRRFIIPNGAVYGSTIENITFHPQRRVDVAIGVEYSADIDRTREVLTSTLEGLEGAIAEPAPAVVLTGLGASSVDWVVRVWCETADFFAVKERLTRAVKMKLDAAGIGIPFPQMDVHLDHRAAE